MPAAHQAQTRARGDRAGGIDGEDDGGEVGGVRLEGVFGVEDREGVGVGELAGAEDGGGEGEGGWGWGREGVGGAGVDGGAVGEE